MRAAGQGAMLLDLGEGEGANKLELVASEQDSTRPSWSNDLST